MISKFWFKLGFLSRLRNLPIPFFCVLLTQYADAAERKLLSRDETQWRICDRPQPFGEGTADWRRPSFDDSKWQRGRGVMGYGDADVQTKMSYGADPQQKPECALFRVQFKGLPQEHGSRLVVGRICCDDGASVWVNGQEVYRQNLPSGAITSRTLAIRAIGPAAKAEREWRPFLINDSVLRNGINTVAISVHQATPTSSDLALAFELVEANDSATIATLRAEVDESLANRPQSEVKVQVQVGPVARLKFK